MRTARATPGTLRTPSAPLAHALVRSLHRVVELLDGHLNLQLFRLHVDTRLVDSALYRLAWVV